MAHIQGKVLLAVTIGPDGGVAQVSALSGHPMLVQAALDAVRHWKYSPFLLNGAPVSVRSQVRVLFTMGPDAPLQQKYFHEETACRDWLRTQSFEDAYSVCNAALRSATALKPEGFGLRISAYGNAGLAAYRLDRIPEALQDFQERLKVAEKDLPSDSADWFDVHHDLALALKASGEMEHAEKEYQETEKALNAESKSLKRGPNLKEYVVERQDQIQQQLRQALTEHAALLRQMGRNSDADELEQRAKSQRVNN